jgi:hypothetical protein
MLDAMLLRHLQHSGQAAISTPGVREFTTELAWPLLLAYVSILAFDFVVARAVCHHTKARWFCTHGAVNLFITLVCVDDVLTTLRSPSESVTGEQYTLWPALLTFTLHLCHMTAPWYARHLDVQDVFHHIAFAGCLGYASLRWAWGPGSNLSFFLICGLPGGVDYLLLCAVKEGWLRPIVEKRVNRWINVWVRAPGLVMCAAWIYSAWAEGKINQRIPTPVVFVCVVLTAMNGMYYGSRVVASHAVHELRASTKADDGARGFAVVRDQPGDGEARGPISSAAALAGVTARAVGHGRK